MGEQVGQAPPFRPLLTAGALSKISLEQCGASLLKPKTKSLQMDPVIPAVFPVL